MNLNKVLVLKYYILIKDIIKFINILIKCLLLMLILYLHNIFYLLKQKKLLPFSTDLSWKNDVFETKNGVLTGRYFNTCYLQRHHIINGWTPKPTINIDCVEIEIAPDNWIMAVDTNDLDLSYLSLSYDIQWKECSCLKGIRLEDVTPELEKRAFEEIENNK